MHQRTSSCVPLWAVLLLWLCSIVIGKATHAQARVPCYAKFETSWTLPHQTGNPFDPAQNDVDVVFHAPDGRTIRVPSFWDGDRWRVRFAPTQVGPYTLTVLRGGLAVHPADLAGSHFRCVPSADSGFVRRDPAHIQRFIRDDGQGFYPLGMDRAWGGGGLPDYPQTFQTMQANGLSWARIWMTFWDNKALEWASDRAKSPPIGQFSLDAARTWDSIFDAADRTGVYVQMCLQHHGQYTNATDPNWRDNPYNIANGGFLQRPEDFFTDPEAERLTRAKYRYIVARWGYSTHLMAFELFNEVYNIVEARPRFDRVVAWHKAMAAYIRSLDVNHHLITTSVTDPPDGPLSKIGLDYDQVHNYVPDVISYFVTQRAVGLPRPMFVGEWGASGAQTEATLHDGLWSGLMTPLAAAPEFWYWEQVQRNNWWPQYRAVTRYVAAAGLSHQAGLQTCAARVTATSGRAALSFAPARGWGAATNSDLTVSPDDGTVTGLGGVSNFLQGSNHRDMTPKPLAFHLRCPSPCEFELLVGTVARAGAHPQLSVDGKVIGEKDYPAGDQDRPVNETLTVPLAPGPHTVTLGNSGPDWFTVSRFTLTDYAPAFGVTAKGNAHAAFFWAYGRDRASTTPVSGRFALSGLAPGVYAVHLWNTQTGQPLAAVHTRAANGRLIVILPPFARDVAGYITSH